MVKLDALAAAVIRGTSYRYNTERRLFDQNKNNNKEWTRHGPNKQHEVVRAQSKPEDHGRYKLVCTQAKRASTVWMRSE
ncbi:hypothetical protein VTO73DRAFT_906 [Trametes versicolor]